VPRARAGSITVSTLHEAEHFLGVPPERVRMLSIGTATASYQPADAVEPPLREAEIHHRRGREIVLIGHAGHPEVEGTMGQLPPGAMTLVETVADVERLTPRDPSKLAYVTQTTLSIDDCTQIIAALTRRFPEIVAPHKEDICYATTNRQEAVKSVAPRVDALIVVGAPNSSNSKRLQEVAERAGCPHAQLVQRAGEIDWTKLAGIRRLGLTAGASAPEVIVEEIRMYEDRPDQLADEYAAALFSLPAPGAVPDSWRWSSSRIAGSSGQSINEPSIVISVAPRNVVTTVTT